MSAAGTTNGAGDPRSTRRTGRAARAVTVGLCATAAPPAVLSPGAAGEWNVATAEQLVGDAAAQGAEIACLPETFASCGAAASWDRMD